MEESLEMMHRSIDHFSLCSVEMLLTTEKKSTELSTVLA